jgi:predicted O-methyltransferase YrrM
MSTHIGLSPELTAYILKHTPETDVAKRLREETEKHPRAGMITMPDQVQFLAQLVHIIGAKRIIEVGTFTGYSALAMASALPADGKLIACDVSHEYTKVGMRYWKEAGVDSRIDLRIAPANDTLATLAKTDAGKFDMMFIDADKTGYDAYYETGLTLLRKGGIVLFDNMLWDGAVADPSDQDRDTSALRALNAKIATDKRVDASLLTIADGMMMARKL